MAETHLLRITQNRIGPDSFNVEVSYEAPGDARRTATSNVKFQLTEQEHEEIRWYLEDYLQFPQDPAPTIAGRIEQRMAEIGENLFKAIFKSNDDASDLWATLRTKLNDTRVEVVTSVEDAAPIPWELVRDPKTGACLVLRAVSFVRGHPQGAQAPKLPSLSGEKEAIRILLVICRPGGRKDVPFRSVASRLIKGLTAEAHQQYQLDVLRPATFARLAEVLRRAKADGKPYHIVHFDGHGMYANMSKGASVSEWLKKLIPFMLSGPRPGSHGYLLFENPGHDENTQLVDGPSLGKLLVETDVPVLVLNACRSAHADPKQTPDSPTEKGEDPHAKVRALGSLAQEVMDAGVAGVVAMRYNVYVMTAARFVADLYGTLVHGQTFGEAVTMGRKQLAADPLREIAFEPRSLQDWCVPVVYEAAPIRLFPPKADTDKVKLTIDTGKTETQPKSLDPTLPKRPDAGFYGRDETLLALDRAFDTQPIVLLHALAGSGKTATAAEFARWYVTTGGLDDGPVLFTSFEHYTPLRTMLGYFGQMFAPMLEQSGVNWSAIADTAQMWDIALQVMKQIPILWIWDNIEPITGFPRGAESAWKPEEQKELADLLRDAYDTKVRFLLTSRRDENDWLGDLPARITVPPMPMQERVQLARALAERHGHKITDVEDWRPLLNFTQGNPLTITVLVGQALRDKLHSKQDIETFVEKLRAGEARFEDEAIEGRSKSLGVSLSYGFAHAFNEDEQKVLALLHFFQGYVNVDALRIMGGDETILQWAGEWSLPDLRSFGRDTLIGLLNRTAEVGLLTIHGDGHYTIHPAVPWFLRDLFKRCYADRELKAARAFVEAMGILGNHYHRQHEGGHRVVASLVADEANLLHAWRLARTHGWWDPVALVMEGLDVLYDHTGRRAEWQQLVEEIVSDFVDPATNGPLPGRQEKWSQVTGYRVRLAEQDRNWAEAERLQVKRADWDRQRASGLLNKTPQSLSDTERNTIRWLAISLENLGHIQREQDLPECVGNYEEALHLSERIADRVEAATCAFNLGSAYMEVESIRDLTKAEKWYHRSLESHDEEDRLRRSGCLSQLGLVEYERFLEARAASRPKEEILKHLNKATRLYHQALELTPPDHLEGVAIDHQQLGNICAEAGTTDQALQHWREAISYYEKIGHWYNAGMCRRNIATALALGGQYEDALDYGRAALHNFEAFGDRAADMIAGTQDLILEIEKAIQDRGKP